MSQPVITDCTPAVYVNGCCPGSLVLQNFFAPESDSTLPVAWTETVAPLVTSFPLPGLITS